MKEKWFISDTHFFHNNILKFKDDAGYLIRPFKSLHEMHELIVNNWNKVIEPGDYVYHLGDVTFQYHKPFQELMYSLNGRKRLGVGNHDDLKKEGLLKHFEKVFLWKGFKEHNFTCSHMPLKEGHFRDGEFNLHGHIHQRILSDPRYMNVCVEVTDYKPINLDQILEFIKQVKETTNWQKS